MSEPPKPLPVEEANCLPQPARCACSGRLVCGNRYEKAARSAGARVIAGVDEVGRGALFGPVVAAAVILPEGCRIQGLRDSKQLIAEERERLARIVERKALAIAIQEVDAETIDRVNIYQAYQAGNDRRGLLPDSRAGSSC